MLTQERLKELLHYDPETGVFTWRVSRGSRKAGQVAGTPDGAGYTQIRVDGVLYRVHILAWLYSTGEFPEHEIDHADRVRNNNTLRNLRASTRKQNAENRGMQSNNKSGFMGVCLFRRDMTWHAQIKHNGKRIHIGYFSTPEEASVAYEAMRDRLFTHHKDA